MEITLWEITAPDGYVLDPNQHSWTLCWDGVNPASEGWHPGTAESVDCSSTDGVLWSVTDPATGASVPGTPMRLADDHYVPVLDGDGLPLLSMLGPDGRPLLGSTVTGLVCNRWDNELNYQCQSLSDYPPIDPAANPTFLRDDIPYRGPSQGMVPSLGTSGTRLLMYQDSAPDGHTVSPKIYGVEWVCGAWRLLEVSEPTMDALLTAPTATCDSPRLTAATMTWTEPPAPSPPGGSLPLGAGTNSSTSSPSASVLPTSTSATAPSSTASRSSRTGNTTRGAGGGALAQTGASVAAPLLTAGALVLTGLGALAHARRRRGRYER